MSETHDFDLKDFKAGVFAVGAQYQVSLREVQSLSCKLTEKGFIGSLNESG